MATILCAYICYWDDVLILSAKVSLSYSGAAFLETTVQFHTIRGLGSYHLLSPARSVNAETSI